MMNKEECLEKAIEITKEWARGGSVGVPSLILESLYEKLVELSQKV